MNNLSYKEKVEAIKSRLGKTPSQVNVERLAKHNKFLKEKNRLDNEKKKADEEAEKLRKALHALKQEEARVAQKKAQEASEAARKAQEATDITKSQERKEREKKARDWVEAKQWEHILWERKHPLYGTGQLLRGSHRNPEPINPKANWFCSDWYIKPQFKEHWDGD
ncbi:hypothetical protein [Vibrio owensii]|uniref:hypothetical protein n=1 Tax=Vibrio owensii TaxID=696485 RepID=UPI0040695F7A